jgi:predicted small metal-binding protein
MEKMKSITCDPECGFMVRSHDENEVMDVAKKHAKDMHEMDASEEELKGMMKTV